MAISPAEVRKAEHWFGRYGTWAVLSGRLVPALRTLISLPAGMARMPLAKLLAFSLVGTALWTGTLVGAGYVLGERYENIAGWLGPVSNIAVAALVLLYIYRVATWSPRQRREDDAGQRATSAGELSRQSAAPPTRTR